jgi:CheY-like chemotaxis protein
VSDQSPASNEQRRLIHDLRNAVGAVLAFAQMLERDDRLPGDLRRGAHLLLQEGRRLSDLVDELLENRPAAEATERTAPPAPEATPALRGSVLVVDDEEVVRTILGSYLARLGLRVDETGAPAEALARLESSPVDLLLTDRHLSGADGLDLARHALELRPELAGRIVVMTADPSAELPPLPGPAGSPRLLAKPFDLADVGRLVAELLPPGPDRSPD